MFTHVLVGFGRGPGGHDALALALRLADPGAKLALAHVDLGGPSLLHSSAGALDASDGRHSRAMLAAARDEAGIDADLYAFTSPTVGRGLHELSEKIDADLIVVGSSSRTLIARVLLGDDTRAALNGAPCAIAVAPSGYERHHAATGEVGVGYDGSPESAVALEFARHLAARDGARVSAFEAVSTPAMALGGDPDIARDLEREVEAARERIAELGDVEAHAAYGHAAEELALYSASVDLLVVGSRGYGPLGRLITGSTSIKLARLARCPLLVLPRGTYVHEPEPPSIEAEPAPVPHS